jgi:hypothetical protein
MVDEYSKSGPRTYSSEANRRVREQKRLLDRVLDKPTEAEFIQALRETMGVTKDHPIYLQAIMYWRSQHR